MTPPRSSPQARSPARLSRDVLIDACIRIADREGPEAVTMRRLGAELGVDATAVYRHFRDKDELVAATADRLLTDAFDSTTFTGDWRRDIRSAVLTVRRAYVAHPRIALMVLSATSPMPNEARVSEATLGIIRRLGLPDRDAVLAFEVLEAYTVAVSCMDGMGSSGSDAWRLEYAALPPTTFPNLTATATMLYADPDERFEFGLDLMLDAIERLVDRHADEA